MGSKDNLHLKKKPSKLLKVFCAHVFLGNLSYSITDQTISVTRGKDLFTTSSLLNSTGETLSYKSSSFSMPLQKHKTWSIVPIWPEDFKKREKR